MWMKQQKKPILICMLIKYFECAYVIFGSKILLGTTPWACICEFFSKEYVWDISS